MRSATTPRSDTTATPGSLKKTYVRVPIRRDRPAIERLASNFFGSMLAPAYLFLAFLHDCPGLLFRARCAALALRLATKPNTLVSYRDILRLLFWPINSVRYFEFDFMWRILSETSIRDYLDVSSPRLFPTVLLYGREDIVGTLINPNRTDLQATASLLKACGLDSRSCVRDCLIENADLEPESFDTITTISVIEHIPDDKQAMLSLWTLLRPGGKLLMSLPCSAVAEEEYVDFDFYGVQRQNEAGFVFHQYKYDCSLLQERIFSVTGLPVRTVIYGEKERGFLSAWLLNAWSGLGTGAWKEPYILARNFRYYDSISDLPGDGVVAMEFAKVSSSS